MDETAPFLANPAALELLAQSGEMGPETVALQRLCPDPMHLFILHPGLLRLRDLAALYAPALESLPATLQDLRARSSRERWNEKRAVFQAKRFAARQDAIIEAESTIMAMYAVDFHLVRLRSLMSRWENLGSHVEEQLARCAAGDRPFTPDLRDACRELREVEARLDEIMPAMGIEQGASRKLTQSRERREDLLEQIGRQLTTLKGADAGRNVLQLVRGGLTEEAG